MRIKTKYLLLVPLIITMLIAMINVSIVLINNNDPKYNFSGWEEFGVFCYVITGISIVVLIIYWFVINWDDDFYINLNFRNKSEEL